MVDGSAPEGNEIGRAPGRDPAPGDRAEAERQISDLIGRQITFGENVSVTLGPATCPACGSDDLTWGCGPEVTLSEEEIHPLVWHETEWMADSYVCRNCSAGWIEHEPGVAITWVRPYWRLDVTDPMGSETSS